MHNTKTATSIAIPDCRQVNFSDIDEICGFAHLLMAEFQEAGAFDFVNPVNSRELTLLRRAGEEWIKQVERLLPTLPSCNRLEILTYYKAIYIPACSSQAPFSYIAPWILKAFDERIKGDQSIASTLLFPFVDEAILKGERSFLERPLKWRSLMLDHWFKLALSPSFMKSPDAERIGIATQLLLADMFMFVSDQTTWKKRLVRQILPLFDRIDELSTTVLMSLLPFLGAMRPEIMPQSVADSHAQRIRRVLVRRTDLSRFHREAFEIELTD